MLTERNEVWSDRVRKETRQTPPHSQGEEENRGAEEAYLKRTDPECAGWPGRGINGMVP